MKTNMLRRLAACIALIVGITASAGAETTRVHLRIGMSCKEVKPVRLDLGIPVPNSSKARFGPETQKRIMARQNALGLDPNGELDVEVNDKGVVTKIIYGDPKRVRKPEKVPPPVSGRPQVAFRGTKNVTTQPVPTAEPKKPNFLTKFVEWLNEGVEGSNAKAEPKKKAEVANFPPPPRGKVLFTLEGDASTYGYNDSMDCGWTSDLFHPLGPDHREKSNVPNYKGIALPMNTLMEKFKEIRVTRYSKKTGKPCGWAWNSFVNVRTCGVYVSCAKTNWEEKGPFYIGNEGPGRGPQKKGVVADLGSGINTAIHGDGMEYVKIRVVSGLFPERAGTMLVSKSAKKAKKVAKETTTATGKKLVAKG